LRLNEIDIFKGFLMGPSAREGEL